MPSKELVSWRQRNVEPLPGIVIEGIRRRISKSFLGLSVILETRNGGCDLDKILDFDEWDQLDRKFQTKYRFYQLASSSIYDSKD